jgi:ACS family hexuronate transporter-like MFS transporter
MVPDTRRKLPELLKLPQTWERSLRKRLQTRYGFVADWFPIYLVAKGFSLKRLIAVWIPFIAADLGNFSAGALLAI